MRNDSCPKSLERYTFFYNILIPSPIYIHTIQQGLLSSDEVRRRHQQPLSPNFAMPLFYYLKRDNIPQTISSYYLSVHTALDSEQATTKITCSFVIQHRYKYTFAVLLLGLHVVSKIVLITLSFSFYVMIAYSSFDLLFCYPTSIYLYKFTEHLLGFHVNCYNQYFNDNAFVTKSRTCDDK